MKVIHNPVKECIINQIFKIDVERITKIQALSDEFLCWANGLLFYMSVFDDEYHHKKQSNGVWHIDSFVYSECKVKPDLLKYNGFPVEIIDLTDFSVIEELTKSIPDLELKNE